MNDHFDVALGRLGDMLKRITSKDPDFDDICAQHADLENVMLAIMQANARV